MVKGLQGKVLLGWMGREQAIKFLMEDCIFPSPLTIPAAEEIWLQRKAVVDELPRDGAARLERIPLSAADEKAVRKFRSRHPNADAIFGFVKLDPSALVVHQLWISTTIAAGYRDRVTPDKWLQTALLDPPEAGGLQPRREGDAIIFDLPHADFVLGPGAQPSAQLRVAEGPAFVSVGLHGDRALLLRGYHRTFACAQFGREAPNAPRGVLFAVSNELQSIGSAADEIFGVMEGGRPPRITDFFDDRLALPVTLRKRRYEMRVHFEVAEIDAEEAAASNSAVKAPAPDPAKEVRNGPGGRGDAQQILAEAMDCHRTGRLEEAIPLYERYVALKPDNASAENNLGAALVALGRIDGAIGHLARALRLKPDWADAHSNMGRVLTLQGRTAEAATYFERALAINPEHADARGNLGSLCYEQGDVEAATEHFNRVLAVAADHVETHNNLANLYKDDGHFDKAMEHYSRAIELKPSHAQAHFNRAELKVFQPGDADLAAMKSLADSNSLPPDEAICIHFALGKAFEDTGDYARAFEHLRTANKLKRRRIEYDEQQAAAVVDRIESTFSREIFDCELSDRSQGSGDPSEVPVFVVGMPRSGTTLIEQILASHPHVYGAGELKHLLDAAVSVLRETGAKARFPESIPLLDRVAIRRIGQTYLARLPVVPAGKIRIVDKMPLNFFNIGLIRLVLPNARIIHAVRDPMDTCVSCYSKMFSSGNKFSYDLAELGRYYCRYHRLMEHWRAVLPANAMFDVVYERVVDDIEGEARRLIEYCGLPWDDRCLDFHNTNRTVKTASCAHVRKPLFRSSVQRWRRFGAGLEPLMRELEAIGCSAGMELKAVG